MYQPSILPISILQTPFFHIFSLTIIKIILVQWLPKPQPKVGVEVVVMRNYCKRGRTETFLDYKTSCLRASLKSSMKTNYDNNLCHGFDIMISAKPAVSKLLPVHLQCVLEWQQWSASRTFSLMRIKEKERRPRLEHRQHLYHMYQGASPMIQGHIELPICGHDQSTRFKYKKCRLIQSEKETTTWAKNPKSVFRCADYQRYPAQHTVYQPCPTLV